MGGCGRQPEPVRERAQLAVVDLVAHQSPGDGRRVDGDMVEGRVPLGVEGGGEKRQVEADVVAHDHRVPPDELEERGEHGGDAGSGANHGFGDAGEIGDGRRDGLVGVHHRLEGAEALAPAELDGANLGDGGRRRRHARGLEVDDDERDVTQRRPELVERPLHGALDDFGHVLRR